MYILSASEIKKNLLQSQNKKCSYCFTHWILKRNRQFSLY